MTKESLMVTIGNNLRNYRLSRNMTQEKLAELVGVSTSFCANIERGKKGVSIFILRDFADALGITANDLLYDGHVDQRIDNIALLLRNKPDAFLSWIEKIVNLSDEDFQGDSI